jgi:3-deoxy-7-phosphoheptulonate synthase
MRRVRVVSHIELEPKIEIGRRSRDEADYAIISKLGRATVAAPNKEPKISEVKDINIDSEERIISPHEITTEFPQSKDSAETVLGSRQRIREIISNPTTSSRLLVIVGPCSIHDTKAALEYAHWLKPLQEQYSDSLEIVMRTYLEKPRTTIGWEGFIEDPDFDKTYNKDKGLRNARKLLLDITELGLPASTELLNTATPQYLDDLISWGAIGARTVESQLHRKLASGVSFPVGFKNGTGGGVQIAADAIETAKHPHVMDGINNAGMYYRFKTKGNEFGHMILRGGSRGPNYSKENIEKAIQILEKDGLTPAIMVDASHKNSGSDHRKQIAVVQSVAEQISEGNQNIVGLMIESNLVEGRQDKAIEYGKSVTDECAGLEQTEAMLDIAARAQRNRALR